MKVVLFNAHFPLHKSQKSMAYMHSNIKRKCFLEAVWTRDDIVCDYVTTWHWTTGNHDVFKPPFGIWVGQQHRNIQSLGTHTHSQSCCPSQYTPSPSHTHTIPGTSHISPQCCTERETQERRPNGLWHNREIKHSCSNLLQLDFIVGFQTISGTTALH